MQDISAYIITYNEERHIRRAIENAHRYAREVYVLDSYSTDRTCEIAEQLGAHVYRRKFTYHADQLNWGLQNIPFATEWIWRQDADEYLTDELIQEIDQTIPTACSDVNAFTAPCLRKFMGRYIKHGIVPLILLRLFRKGHAQWENKRMDEHIYVTDGQIGELKQAFFDDSLLTLSEWTQKHNGYSTKESIELLCAEYGLNESPAVVRSGAHSMSVRRNKLRYARMPLFWRAFGFFCYRYFFRCGFLDGKEGFIWHSLQGFWYRMLVDAKIFEFKKRFGFDNEAIRTYLIDNYLTKVNRGGKTLTIS
jgi:glycosyltransferase involved in cell wall biosynthesis